MSRLRFKTTGRPWPVCSRSSFPDRLHFLANYRRALLSCPVLCCAVLCCAVLCWLTVLCRAMLGLSMTAAVTHSVHLLACYTQDDKAVDRAWKKESAEAGDGLGQVLYQLFKNRRLADLLVTTLRDLHECNVWEVCKIDVSCSKQQSHQKGCQLSKEQALHPICKLYSFCFPPPSPRPHPYVDVTHWG